MLVSVLTLTDTNTDENTDLALVERKAKLTIMDFGKGGIDGQVNKVIDQAAGAAKKKINQAIGGNQGKDNPQAGGGIGNMVSGAITKAAVDKASDNAADQALAFGKKMLG